MGENTGERDGERDGERRERERREKGERKTRRDKDGKKERTMLVGPTTLDAPCKHIHTYTPTRIRTYTQTRIYAYTHLSSSPFPERMVDRHLQRSLTVLLTV